MRVVVTGGAGQLARDIERRWTHEGDDVVSLTRDQVDVSRRDDVLGAITSLQPDMVVNCAAWTAVDACEGDPERAFSVNALGVRWVREACERAGVHLVQVSTDYVFDGTLHRPYLEWDRPDPRSVYGASKLGGEREAGPDATIVRTSWVCGEHGNNMVRTVLRLVTERSSLSFVDDQRGCPTFTTDLADAVRRLAVDRRSGVYHVTNAGAVSWYEFVRDIVAAAGYDPAIVHPITTADLDPPRPAPRPANSVLDNAAMRMSGLPPMRHYRDPLHDLVSRLRA
ncbi:MAG TPA: dTDP-4-dehydrorhamnose reductase [Ilumatobacter sp.]|nr:dTDP-4-dehydrorhamnose reductase [Ilumatobacter sp.]